LAEKLMTQRRRYLSYLLRLWQESGGASDLPGKAPVWRASLESPQSDECQGFASLNELVAFLREQTGGALPVDGIEKDEGKPKRSAESEED
jgi:hypothetical protein